MIAARVQFQTKSTGILEVEEGGKWEGKGRNRERNDSPGRKEIEREEGILDRVKSESRQKAVIINGQTWWTIGPWKRKRRRKEEERKGQERRRKERVEAALTIGQTTNE